jgi:8-amino-7-oxononanoate synthase
MRLGMKALRADLARRAAAQLYRRRRTLEGPQGPELPVGGRRLLAFCSNDYLGLAADPRLVRALQAGAERFGAGSGAAHLVTGHMRPHHALEEELAEFLGRPRALLFSTGYMANLGVIAGLLGAGDSVWEDRLNHASLIDGGLLSRARFRRYPHADAKALDRALNKGGDGRIMLVTDGVFSMDGDLAPLPELVQVASRHRAWVMVDDAHGLGVVGRSGRGVLEHFGIASDEVPVLVGTLGKAFGTFGAFVAGDEALVETLIQTARSYVYTTAPPPALAEATRASLRIVQEEGWRRQRLAELVARFRAGAVELGLPLMPSATPIQPLLAGDTARALRWSRRLEERGVLVPAIRPPTVPEGAARLRVTFTAGHTEAQVDRLLGELERMLKDNAADAA